MHKNLGILTIPKILANIVKWYFPGKFIASKSVPPSKAILYPCVWGNRIWLTSAGSADPKLLKCVSNFSNSFSLWNYMLSKSSNWFFCPPTVVFGHKRRTRTHTKNLGHTFQAPSLSWPSANFRAIRLAHRVQNSFFVPVPLGFLSPEKKGFYYSAVVKYTSGPHKPH